MRFFLLHFLTFFSEYGILEQKSMSSLDERYRIMTEQEMKKLRRGELLEILMDLSKENEVLRAQLDKARSQLTSRTIAVEKSGSLAEAALRINGVFEACQAACDQYTLNLQQRVANQEQICREMEEKAAAKCTRMISEAEFQSEKCLREAHEKANFIHQDAAKAAEEYAAKTRAEADEYARKLRAEVDALKAEVVEQKSRLCGEAEAESEKIRAEADEYSRKTRAEADEYRAEAQKVVKELVASHEWLMKGLQ